MSVWSALAGGFVGTLVLTTAIAAGSQLGLTRIDIPFLLGTAFSLDRARARVIGYLVHFAVGCAFALGYFAVFLALGWSSWWLGAFLGLCHALFAGTAMVNTWLPLIHPRMGSPMTAAADAPLLEAPGFMLLNYGLATPIVTVVAHVLYGAIIGAFVSLATR
jgi:hypothetical protein